MRGRHKILLIVGGIGLLLGLVGYLVPQGKTEVPLRIFYDTAGGAVLFPHREHVGPMDTAFRGVVEMTCSDCHHKLVIPDEWLHCSECHGDDYVPEDLEHLDMVDIHAPSCSVCHASRGEEQVAIEGSACTECHLERSRVEVVHDQCYQCHEEIQKGTYVGKAQADVTYCDICHLSTQ